MAREVRPAGRWGSCPMQEGTPLLPILRGQIFISLGLACTCGLYCCREDSMPPISTETLLHNSSGTTLLYPKWHRSTEAGFCCGLQHPARPALGSQPWAALPFGSGQGDKWCLVPKSLYSFYINRVVESHHVLLLWAGIGTWGSLKLWRIRPKRQLTFKDR